MGEHVEIEVDAICERIGCRNGFTINLGRGRPRRYCCDECRRDADTDRKRCVARIERMRELLRREEHLLAAMGEPIPATTIPLLAGEWTEATDPPPCTRCNGTGYVLQRTFGEDGDDYKEAVECGCHAFERRREMERQEDRP